MALTAYVRRLGDRKEGRLLRGLPAFSRIGPFVMARRGDSCTLFSDSIEVTQSEEWLRAQSEEGRRDLNFLHLLISAYIRTISMRPGVNRFVAGQRLYGRRNIEVVMFAKSGPSAGAPQTSVKVSFSPTDTVFDVSRRMNKAVDELKADTGENKTDRIARVLTRAPRLVLRLAISVLKFLDYFDWLPQSLLDASPFHGSVVLSDFGSLGVPPVYQHLYDIGNVPLTVTYGAKRPVTELGRDGQPEERRLVDFRITCDGRVADGPYFAGALKILKYFLKNPRLLETPPQSVEEDVN